MRKWKLEDAQNRFREVVRRARTEGPQLVTRDGHAEVVVLRAEDYARLTAPSSLVDFLRESPLAEALADRELDLSRPAEPDRDTRF